MPHIVIVAFDAAAAQASMQRLGDALTFEVIDNEDELAARLNAANPDLVLLHMLPLPQDNIDACYRVRTQPQARTLPIIIVTALGDETDMVAALNAGADDYVLMPFSSRELIARIHSAIRRFRVSDTTTRPVTIGGLFFDRDARRVTQDGRTLHLRPVEFALLDYMIARPGRTITRTSFKEGVWGSPNAVTDRVVDVNIGRLRQALSIEGKASPIVTIRHFGYKIDVE